VSRSRLARESKPVALSYLDARATAKAATEADPSLDLAPGRLFGMTSKKSSGKYKAKTKTKCGGISTTQQTMKSSVAPVEMTRFFRWGEMKRQ
jgi:hypothetical protein